MVLAQLFILDSRSDALASIIEFIS
jgi:hypothetical protein